MDGQQLVQVLLLTFIISSVIQKKCEAMSRAEKKVVREKVLEMFNHAYSNYMDKAYPLDELMPLSCKGRGRDTEPSRGDVDDSLGNFSLTLVDTLDTLVVLGLLEEFEHAVGLVIRDVSFDRDIVVSVFETNIRMMGGLLGGHTMAVYLKQRKKGMEWYNNELLDMAQDLGYRLLPAFNTSTGIPYPRVNLRYGVKHPASRTGSEKDTCTSCAGTMILEFSALSRMTGIPVFEEKAEKAMDQLWSARNRGSDLMGTVINIHNGDWVRRDSGVGAGIDSYYEYLLKAYILLGDESYLDRFNKHYRAVMKYISQGPMMVDVHMHRPLSNSKNFMDSLLAFWPGLQVLKGDIKPAIETHEMLYQVMQRHNFLPEAFTTDFRVHWAQHPLRPEFIESTYFIYKATGDPHYLEVGKKVIDNLEKHARVPCGFAALKDVTTGVHEDQMDSFVLAETFKYLHLLFADKEDLVLDVDSFVFTTEAHLLPLSLSMNDSKLNISKDSSVFVFHDDDDDDYERSCPNTNHMFKGNMNFAQNLRHPLKNFVEKVCPRPALGSRQPRLRAGDFMAGNKDQLTQLGRMGIRIVTMQDGRVQLLHTASEAASTEEGEDGMLFMQEMIELSKTQAQEVQQEPRMVQLISPPYLGSLQLNAGPAQFGLDVKTIDGVYGQLALATPYKGCKQLVNHEHISNKIVIMERGECMFIDKARSIQTGGAIGGIVIDNVAGSSSKTMPLFAMSGDGKSDVTIPMLFLFHHEGNKLLDALRKHPDLWVRLGYKSKPAEEIYNILKGLKISLDPETLQAQSAPAQTTTDTTTTESQTPAPPGDPKIMSFVDEIKDTKDMLQDLVNKLNLKDVNVRLRSKVAGGQQTATGPNDVNIQQIHIPAEQLLSNNNAKANSAFKDMMSLLESQEKGPNLDSQQKDYLEKVKKMIHRALQSGNGVFGGEVQKKLDELTRELKIKSGVAKPELKVESEEEVAEDGVAKDPIEATLDNLSKKLDAALDDYINTQFDKVLEEAKQGLEDLEDLESGPETPKVETPSEQTEDTTTQGTTTEGKDIVEAIDTTGQGQVSAEEVPKGEVRREDLKSYATQEDLEATPGDRTRRYKPPNVQKAPEWMALEEGQIFIDQEGNIFVKDGPDDIEGHLDLEREAEVYREEYGEEYGDKYGDKTDSAGEGTKLDYQKLRNNLFAQQDSLAGQESPSAGTEGDIEADTYDMPKIKLDIKSLAPSEDPEGGSGDSQKAAQGSSEGGASNSRTASDNTNQGGTRATSASSSQDSVGDKSVSQDSDSKHREKTPLETRQDETDARDEL